MTIRTTEQLSDQIAAELAWRRKELTNIRYFVQTVQDPPARGRLLRRSGLAMLYAHWEGFVKLVGSYYLEYVSMQRLKYEELQTCFLAIALKGKLRPAADSRKLSTFAALADVVGNRMGERCFLPHKNVVETEANLSSSVFKEITWMLGVDYSPYEGKERLMDLRLLWRRNHIAHGRDQDIDTDDYLELHREVVDMMDLFRNQIENAAVTRGYRKH